MGWKAGIRSRDRSSCQFPVSVFGDSELNVMFSSATRSVIQRLLILTVLISCLALFSTGVSRRSFGTSLGQSPERVTEQIAARPQTAQVSTNNTRPRIQIGAKLPLEGVDWATNQKTLVVALSDKCHFCTDS